MNDAKLIIALVRESYDSGYYSGKREDGQPHHLAAIKERGRLQNEVLQRLASLRQALEASDAALRHHPGGDNRSKEDITAATTALGKARGERSE